MKKKVIIIIGILVVLVAVILCIIFNNKKNNRPIIGTWTTDGVTIYKFNSDNTGLLIVSLKEYKFNYKIDEHTIFIDFENEKSEDSKYTYSFVDDKLILNGDNGIFTFIRKENEKKKSIK